MFGPGPNDWVGPKWWILVNGVVPNGGFLVKFIPKLDQNAPCSLVDGSHTLSGAVAVPGRWYGHGTYTGMHLPGIHTRAYTPRYTHHGHTHPRYTHHGSPTTGLRASHHWSTGLPPLVFWSIWLKIHQFWLILAQNPPILAHFGSKTPFGTLCTPHLGPSAHPFGTLQPWVPTSHGTLQPWVPTSQQWMDNRPLYVHTPTPGEVGQGCPDCTQATPASPPASGALRGELLGLQCI